MAAASGSHRLWIGRNPSQESSMLAEISRSHCRAMICQKTQGRLEGG